MDLALENQWLRAMVDALDDPVVVLDQANDIVLRNSRAEFLFRARDDETEGRRHAVRLNNFLFTAALSSWKLEPAGPAAPREVTLVDAVEGEELVYEVIARPIGQRGSRGTVALLKDVTELRHVSEELARRRQELETASEEVRLERDRLDQILMSAANPIVVLDADEGTIAMNPAALHVLGGSHEAPDRRRQIVLMNQTRFTSFISRMRLEAGTRHAGEVVLTDPDDERPLEMAVTIGEIRDPRGVTSGFVAVLQDIGGLRELARLQELDELKSRFLSIASHELRTPITSVSGFAQLALRRLQARLEQAPPNDEPWRAELERLVRQLTVIHDQSIRLGRLVGELLDVSRIQSGRLEYSLVPVDAGEVARQVVEQMRMISADHPIHFAADGALTVNGDRDRLEQVIANLIENAVKYSRPGSAIDVTLSQEGQQAVLAVADQGVGIPADQLERIFDLFYRTRDAEVRQTPGLGLGLYIARGIVERHRGRIWLESSPGEGTVARVALPLASAGGAELGGDGGEQVVDVEGLDHHGHGVDRSRPLLGVSRGA